MKRSTQGFTLLFAILTISALLSVVLAIINITFKQLTLSSIGKESQIAFYAADSGAECARYWDINFNSFATSSTQTITCNKQDFVVGGTVSGNSVVNRANGVTVRRSRDCSGNDDCIVTTFKFKLHTAEARSPEIQVHVSKNIETGETIIESFGRNTDDTNSKRRLERAVRLTYFPPYRLCSVNADIMVLMDMSGSVAENMGKLKAATQELVEGLIDAPSDTRVGFLRYNHEPDINDMVFLTNNKATINSKINSAVSSGGTNIAGSIRVARNHLKGLTNKNKSNASQVEVENPRSDRDDNQFPDYILLITDGEPHSYINYAHSLERYEQCLDPGTGNCLTSTRKEADDAKGEGISIYTIGIGVTNPERKCEGHSTCAKYLDEEIAGDPGNTDPNSSANSGGVNGIRYSYVATTFEDLPRIVNNITACN